MANGEGDIRVEKDKTVPGGGIEIEQQEGEIAPPILEEEERTEEEAKEVPGAQKVAGKIAISAAVIKPPLRLEGNLLADITGWAGWLYTEEELEDICQLIAQCGWELQPQYQALIALATLHGVRFVGFTAWKRKGRPGDLRSKKQTGVDPLPRKPDEEVSK